MSISQQLNVSNLRLFVYDRSVHPELFDIYHDHRVRMEGYEAQIWVTGCSHVISFFRGDHTVTELIADCEAELPTRGRLVEMPFRGERDHELKQPDGISYMMNFQVESMSPGVYTETHHELARLGARRGLFVPFPMWMVNSLTPFTYVDYHAKSNGLHVFAFHTFPESLTIIKTQSIFELA